jgi:ABC-type amino acid transport substrate-binding protein
MNERLLALQKQAYAYADKNTQEGDNQFAMIQLGKFAELIVQECIRVSDDLYQGSERLDAGTVHYYDVDVGEELAKHFGVE